MKNSVLTIMKKELKRFFCDRRMVMTTVLLPGLMIYLIYSLMGNALTDSFGVDEGYTYTVKAVNLPENIKAMWSADGMYKITDVKAEDAEKFKDDITDGELDLLAVFPQDFEAAVAEHLNNPGIKKVAPNVELYYNSSRNESESAFSYAAGVLDAYKSQLVDLFDINYEIAGDLAKNEDITAKIFSMMLPMLLLVFMFSGCVAVAPESIAGEKERGTIATMLITPVKRGNIAVGKILALSVIALLSGISSTAGTVLSLPKLMGAEASGVVENVYGFKDYAMLAVVILSTVLLIVSLVSIISAYAKTVKEAQTYVSPLMIVTMLVGVTAMFSGGIRTEIWYYLIPLYNSVECMVGIFSFNAVPLYMAVTVIANVCYAALGAAVLSQMFNSEKIIFSN